LDLSGSPIGSREWPARCREAAGSVPATLLSLVVWLIVAFGLLTLAGGPA
jgi:hypothetical protein